MRCCNNVVSSRKITSKGISGPKNISGEQIEKEIYTLLDVLFFWSVFVRFADVQKIRTQGPVLVKGARWSSKPPSVWLYTATQLYIFENIRL
jgi:hypothetical protein